MGDIIYVAVNQIVRESKPTLLWTLETLPVKKIFLLHVHLPFSLTTSSSRLTQSEIDAIQDSELNTSYQSLHKYRDICINKNVHGDDTDISVISEYDVGKGIVELIKQNNIKNLVMGAAADPHYSRGMSTITSRKAKYVLQHAPRSCKMWFICKGKLIKTGEGSCNLWNPSDSFSEFSNSVEKPRRDETESPKEHPGQDEAEKKVKKKAGKSKPNAREADTSPSPPHDYRCPITLGIMRDPHVAADGFTYEGEAIKEYLRRGGGGGGGIKKKSPKTLEPLENHNLVPNRNLRIIINEWLVKHPNYTID